MFFLFYLQIKMRPKMDTWSFHEIKRRKKILKNKK